MHEAMVRKGKYKVAGVLNISRSLSSQRNDPESAGIHKAVLQQASSSIVVYFTDQIDFGPGTKINIRQSLPSVLLTSRDYEITERREYRTNLALIDSLLERCRNRC
jgi:hypothetical protein